MIVYLHGVSLEGGDVKNFDVQTVAEALIIFKAEHLANPAHNAGTYNPQTKKLWVKQLHSTKPQPNDTVITFVGGYAA
jgi:hypothetical protein